MKTLLALLAAGVAVGAGYWKYQNPEGGVEELRSQATQTVNRLKGGLVAVRDGSEAQQLRQAKMDEVALGQEAMQAKIESISQSLEGGLSSARTEVVDGRLLDAERRMDAFNSRMDKINADADASTTKIVSVAAELGSTNEKYSALTGQLELINRRLDEQADDQTLNGINNDIQRIEARVSELSEASTSTKTELESRVASIEDQSGSMLARFNTLSATAATTNNDSGEETANLRAQIDQRLQEVEKKFETTNSDSRKMNILLQRFDQSREQLALLQEQQQKSLDTISALQSEIAELRTKNESLSIDGLQEQVKQQLAEVRKQIESASASGTTDADALSTALDATRSRIQTLEQRVQSLPAASNAASEAQQVQSGLENQIAALEAKLSEVSTTPDPGLISTITEVQQQVSALESDLRKQQKGKTITYKIYFDRGSTGITDAAAKVLNSFIAQEKNRTTGVSIYGFTDRRGSAEYNQRLALQRATNVRSYLIQKGFDYTKIQSLSGLGEDAAAASTEDEVEDAQQRTVVLFAAQP